LTQQKSVWDHLNERRPILGTVPSADEEFVCDLCLGPVTEYTECFACKKAFGGAPWELQRRVVPMTSVVKPSPWYSSAPQYMPVLASVAHAYLDAHQADIARMIGGAPDLITIVPSKRGYVYERQPLKHTLSMSSRLRERLAQTMTHDPKIVVGRQEYNPKAFKVMAQVVKGKRIILVEDTWVTGSTAVSAAGALLEAGASEVAIMPIARVLNDGFWPPDHPYREAMKAPYDHSAWPRD
jgi:predicted amidophosphoribosyltransferase